MLNVPYLSGNKQLIRLRNWIFHHILDNDYKKRRIFRHSRVQTELGVFRLRSGRDDSPDVGSLPPWLECSPELVLVGWLPDALPETLEFDLWELFCVSVNTSVVHCDTKCSSCCCCCCHCDGSSRCFERSRCSWSSIDVWNIKKWIADSVRICVIHGDYSSRQWNHADELLWLAFWNNRLSLIYMYVTSLSFTAIFTFSVNSAWWRFLTMK